MRVGGDGGGGAVIVVNGKDEVSRTVDQVLLVLAGDYLCSE